MADIVKIRWPTIARTTALAAVIYALAILSFEPNGEEQTTRTLIEAIVSLVLMSSWIIMLLAPSWSIATPTALAGRVRAVAVQRRAIGVATPIVVIAFVPSVFTAKLFGPGDAEVVSFSIFVALIIGAGLEYSHAGLRKDSELIEDQLADLAPVHRRNAEDALVTDRKDLWRSVMPWIAILPASAVIAVPSLP